MIHGKSLRVCFVSNSSGKSGGAERTLPKFVHALKLRGYEVSVILPTKGEMLIELEKLNIKCVVLPYRMWMFHNRTLFKKIAISVFNLLMTIPISFYLIKWNCSVVFSNTITVSVGALAAKLTGKKHIWYIREFGSEDHGRTFDMGNKFSYWLIRMLSDLYIFNSFAVKEKYVNTLPLEKLRVVYEGYITKEQILSRETTDHHFCKRNDIVHCLMIGTLQEGKGHEDAIKAIGVLRDSGLNVILEILGIGYDEYKNKLQSLIEIQKLEKNVHFCGFIEDPFPVINKCDIFLMCSKMEAFGIVTIEAMQFGKPIIGTRSGGTKELIIDGFNGLFYSPGNYSELAEKIRYLIENPDISKLLGENAKNLAFSKFTFDRYLDEMSSVIQELSK